MAETHSPPRGESQSDTSFAAFYAREYPRIAELAYALTGDRWIGEDLAQDSFIAARQNWAEVGTYPAPGAWIRRVVANKAVSRYRRIQVERKALPRLWRRPTGDTPPEVAAEAAEIWAAVRRLPKRQAQVIALTYLEGHSLSDIGEILQCSPFTAKTHLQRGKQALATLLRANEEVTE